MAGPWPTSQPLLRGAAICLLLAMVGQITEAKGTVCRGNPAAFAALRSTQNFTVQKIDNVGYGFYFVDPALSPIVGGPNVTRGLVILPEVGVAPAAYAPYARGVALLGYYVTIVDASTPGQVLEAMMQHPELQYWALAGHGTGGELAARIAITLQPKVKALVLIAAALPPDVDLQSINLFLTVIYSANDSITSPTNVTNFFSRVAGDASVTQLPGLGHYDFAYSACLGNIRAPANGNSSVLTSTVASTITLLLGAALEFSQWADGTKGAYSYGDNHYLTPGFNDSKPYPGAIRVHFDQYPIPGTFPQRLWWVFTPSQIKGGIVYYPGAAVAGSAYFPLAFEIAARGHLVVVVQQPSRNGFSSFTDANTVIDSNFTMFSGVPAGRWAVGGHSQGGLGAATYATCFGNKIYAAVLHSGGWLYSTNTSQVPFLQLYGSIDNLSGLGKDAPKNLYLGLVNLNKTTFLSVPGATHYQVGDYGYQVPDQIATISLETQHAIFANDTVNYLDALETKVYAPVLSGPFCIPTS